jgi:hypothetical protein
MIACLAGSCLLGSLVFGAADDKTPAPGLVVIDNAGKEVKLKSRKFTNGTVHLSWLAEKAPADKKKLAVAQGPEALEFRELKSTTFEEGIKTLVPLSAIRKIDYDKKVITITLVNAEGKDEVLRGSTEFVRINKLAIEAEADLGALGVATVKYLGGHLKDGIRGLRFASPKPLPAATGKQAVVVAQDKEKHTVFDLMPVYRQANGSLQLSPTLYFKPKAKVDVTKIQKLRHIESENKKLESYDFEVTLDDGVKHTLTLLKKNPDDAKAGTLVGLVGRVSAGYKLFPMPHTLGEVQFESKKEAP